MLSRRGLLLAGGAFVSTLAGCTLNSYHLNLLTAPKGQETYLPGSIEICAQATQKALLDMGLIVSTSRDTDRVVLTGVTRSQRRFSINLVRHQETPTKEPRTRIDIQWETDPDEQFWIDLLAAVARVQLARAGGR